MTVAHRTRLGSPEDADAICRLAWRTYGPTYQHDEYYQPDRLARMLADGTQVSFVTVLDSGELVGHSAVLLEGPGAVVVEGGRAMVDPRFRGHHLMSAPWQLQQQQRFADHGVLAMEGAAVTAHTRSQRDGPIVSVLLGFLPPIRFEGIDGTETGLREAVVGGLVPMGEIPRQRVHLPRRDAAMLEHLYEAIGLDRHVVPDHVPPSAGSSSLDVLVRPDLGHAVVVVNAIGADLGVALRQRLDAVARGGIEVTYVDLALDDPATSWAADVVADAGGILAGLQPLERGGVDVVRYQHLGPTLVDPEAIHLRSPDARALLDYVLAQRGGAS